MKGFFTFFKYEFLSSAIPLAFTYGIGILALSLLEVFNTHFSSKWFFYELLLADGIGILLATLMVGSFIAFSVLLIVRAFQSFWVEIFGSRGYLTLTLPLSLDAILLSKIIVLAFWAVFGINFAPVFIKIFYDSESFVAILLDINIQNALVAFFDLLLLTIFYITLILFITALLNALKVRTFVLFKGFGIALVIHLLWIPFTSLISFGFLISIDKLFLSIVFYFAARYLIMYKLELE